MADSTAAHLDPEDANAFVYYATAVAKHLITRGVVPTTVDVDTPHIVDHSGELSEGEAWVYPPRELCARLSPIAEAVLTWDEISGWSATIYQDDDHGDKHWLPSLDTPSAPASAARIATATAAPSESDTGQRPRASPRSGSGQGIGQR